MVNEQLLDVLGDGVTHDQAFAHTNEVLPILNQALATPPPGGAGQAQQPEDGNLSTPSVWCTNRRQAAAEVDALASNGMDEIEIPALLRRQADRGRRPAGQAQLADPSSASK